MLVAFDSDLLSLLLNPAIIPPVDPATGQPTDRSGERLEYLVSELEKSKTRIIIPAPALAELLVIADESGPDYLTEIDRNSIFSVEAFDARAAIEAAAATRKALARGNKKSGATGVWQAVKTDRQIVAVAKTRGATCIYSNDGDIANIAADSGVDVIMIWQLPVPPETQTPLPLEGVPNAPPAEDVELT